MAEIDRIVVLDIERDGSSSTTAEQEMVILRNDLASTDPTKGAGMVGYRSSESYSDETVGKALTDIESNMSAVEDSASQALSKSNEALAKATTAESRIDNALLKGNNLSDLANKATALVNLGAVALADISENPAAGKTPKAGSDGKMDMSWIRNLEYSIKSLQRDIEAMKYPDGIIPYIDWDFTAQALPAGLEFKRPSPAAYCDKDGYLALADINQPVFEYDYSAGSILGLRKEPDSTNIFAHSTYNRDYWDSSGGSSSVNTNYSISPDKSNTSSILRTTTEGGNTPYIGKRRMVWEAGEDYTSSVFFKINPESRPLNVRLVLHSEVFGNDKNLYFNIKTGDLTVHTNGIFVPKKYGSQKFANGWVRIWMTDTVREDFSGSGYSPLIWMVSPLMPGEGVEFWGMQLEKGAVMTSFIQTKGSEVTRRGDSLGYQQEGLLKSYEVTISIDVRNNFLTKYPNFCAVVGEAGNNLNYIGLGYSSTSIAASGTQTYYRFPDSGDGNTGGNISSSNTINPTDRDIRVAFSTKAAQKSRVSVNGKPVVESTFEGTYDIYSSANRINFFSGSDSITSQQSFCYLRNFKLFNKSLSDDKLVSLTIG